MALTADEIKEVRRLIRREFAALSGMQLSPTTGKINTLAENVINNRIAELDAVFGGDAFA